MCAHVALMQETLSILLPCMHSFDSNKLKNSIALEIQQYYPTSKKAYKIDASLYRRVISCNCSVQIQGFVLILAMMVIPKHAHVPVQRINFSLIIP